MNKEIIFRSRATPAIRPTPARREKSPPAPKLPPERQKEIKEKARAKRDQIQKARLDDPDRFPDEALPELIRNIAGNVAEINQIDVALPAMAALATLSAAIGKSVVVNGAANGRETPTNLYLVAAAPKSYGKGAAGQVVQPLLDATRKLQEQFHEKDHARLQAELEVVTQQKKKVLKQSTEADPRSKESLEVLAEMNTRIDEFKRLLKHPPAYHIGAATGAALEESLARNNEQIFSFAPEAGDMVRSALGKMGRQATDLFLSGYSGENSASARISRGTKNLEPCITVLWMVQPTLLRELYSDEEVLDRGLSARIMAFCVDHDSVPLDDGKKREPDSEFRESWKKCIDQVLTDRQTRRTITTSDQARELFRTWHNWSVELRNEEYRDISSELGRWRENAIRIAGVLAVAEGREEIDPDLARKAIALCAWCVRQNLNLLSAGRIERMRKRVRQLKDLLANGEQSLRDLTKSHGFARREIEQIVEKNPEQFEIITYKPPGGGRPSPRIRLARPKEV